MTVPTGPTAPSAVAPAQPASPLDAGSGPPSAPGSDPPQQPGAQDAASSGDAEQSAPESHGIGSGEDAAAATASHGGGSFRREALRKAGRNIAGDFVAGDKFYFVHGAERTLRLRMMPPNLLESAESAFVVPPGWDEVLVAFAKSRVLLLRGNRGHGKTTAAIRLLLRGNARRVYHVDSSELGQLAEALQAVDSADGADRDALRGAGFVLDHPREFAALGPSALRGIEAALELAKARLVIVVGSAEPIRDAAFLDFAVEISEAPDRREVLIAHLNRLLDERSAAELLARPEIEELVAEYLVDETPCSAVARLAARLADDEQMAGRADIARVREGLSERDDADFGTWFAQLPDAETRSHAIALAVLGGAGHETVARAARSLRERLVPKTNVIVSMSAHDESSARDPFRRTQGELLSVLRARATTETIEGPYGTGPARIVEYRDPSYPSKVLRHVWTQYAVQEELLAWLGELTDNQAEQVRVSAGTALGVLSLISFEHVCRRVLAPWAQSTKSNQREAVAYALRVAADDAVLLTNVRDLTGGWYASSGQEAAQATAARIYGLSLGPLDPAGAVDALMRLMVVNDIRVAIAIGNALTDLLLDGSAELARTVLARLLEATEDDRKAAAQLAFLQIAVLILVEKPAASQGSPTVKWPFLLDLAGTRQDVRDDFIRLWQSVLESAIFHREAANVLTAWAGRAQADSALRDAYLRLVRAVAQSHDRPRRSLSRLAATWVSADNLAPLVEMSAELQRVLPKDTL
jgi:hypothetical protein